MERTPSGPDQDRDQGSTERTESRGWQQVALGALVLIALVVTVVMAVVPIPWFTEPQPAEAVKHPPYPPGQACAATGCHDDFTHKQPYDERDCALCHTTESWADVHYAHADVQMNKGIHAVIGCSRCHTYGKPAPSGACQTCHKSTSPHKLPAYTNCANCHQAIGWNFLKLPPGHISLAGGHAGLECTACHDEDTFAVPGPDCANCHGPKHGYYSGCAKCHNPANFWNVDPGSIDHSFFPFGKAHAEVQCVACHPALRFVGTNPECAACHGANHGFNSGCTRCHSVYIGGWKAKHFNHEFYPLRGVHAAFDCGACHPSRTYRLPNPDQSKGGYLPPAKHLIFVGEAPSCQKCHGAPHGNCLSTACFKCHGTGTWRKVNFNHRNYWPYYTGAHTKLACSKCHVGLKFCQLRPGMRRNCASSGCHGSNHGYPTSASGSTCLRCHNTWSWSQVHFNHRAVWSDYTGAHTRVACSRCHPGNRWYPPPSPACSSCHGQPHGPCIGNGETCDNCHTTSSWGNATFNHRQVWSDYTGAHTSLSCGACHPFNQRYKDQTGFSTYIFCSLLDDFGTRCVQCHTFGNTGHGYSTGSSTSVCTQCHSTSNFWPLVSSWNHVIPLGGFHSQNNVRPNGTSRCNMCHLNYNFVNAARSCANCHPRAPHGDCFDGVNCIKCHWPTTWTNLHFSHLNPAQVGSYGAKVYDIHLDEGLPCTACHTGGSYCPDAVKCTPCHKSPPPVQ